MCLTLFSFFLFFFHLLDLPDRWSFMHQDSSDSVVYIKDKSLFSETFWTVLYYPPHLVSKAG